MSNRLKRLLKSYKGLSKLFASDARTQNSDKENSVISSVAMEIGQGWASNTINTTIFRHHAILTMDGAQYTAFYVDTKRLRIVKRDLATAELETCDIQGTFNLHDAHNGISLGHDRNHRLHITYDHHASKLQYRIAA